MKSGFRVLLVVLLPWWVYAQKSTFDDYRKKADACLTQGDYTCAKENYERALRIRENDPHCKNGLAKAGQLLKNAAKPAKPKPPKPSPPPVVISPAITAYLLVQTDLAVYLQVNGGSRHFVSPNDVAKKIPLDAGANIISVKPLDGGTDGYVKTVSVAQSGNQLFNIHLLADRKAAEARSKPVRPVAEEPARPANNPPPTQKPEPPKPAPKQDILAEELSRNMVLVKGGTFQMGGNNEKPVHTVSLNDFYISKYEITQRQWRNIMGTLPPNLSVQGCNDCPIEQISWDAVREFIRKLNERTGTKYRLPTEAEWEYAARGGQQSSGQLPEGKKELQEISWYRNNSGKKAHPVGQKLPNELGLYDMLGNVWEWCQDWYSKNFYARSPVNNPVNLTEDKYRVIRGGSLDTNADATGVTTRDAFKPSSDNGFIGFRLARD